MVINFFQWLRTKDNVYQDIGKKLSRKLKIQNPQGITLTVVGQHSSDGKYSTWSGDAYRLAEVLTAGIGGQTPRPFMFLAKEKIKNNAAIKKRCSEMLKESINKKLKLSKSVAAEGGVWIDWDAYGNKVVNMVHEWIADGSLLAGYPLEETTKEKKAWAGYDTNAPLYATGELAKMITYVLR